MDNLLKKLSEIAGVTGDEGRVRDLIKEEAKPYATDMVTDAMGNLIVYKKGTVGAKKGLLAAHMDEVGFIVTSVSDDGFIRFDSMGGVDTRTVLSQRVKVTHNDIKGIFGIKAVHLQGWEERRNLLGAGSLYVDVGAKSKDETGVKIGDFIAFDTEFKDFGEGLMKGKALDDRIGCANLLHLMKNEYEDDLYFCFTVQEEIGTRGASLCAHRVKPDYALILEGTFAYDVPDVPNGKEVTRLGCGPAITVADNTVICHRGLVDKLIEVADANGIPHQFKGLIAGGTDAATL